MNNLNSILIEGNLVKDPQIRSTPKGSQVCNMRLASNRFYKLDNNSPGFEKEVSYFDVESWGKLAEACCTKGKKGRGIRVVGRLKQSRWNDADGKQHSRVTIVAEHVEFRPEFKRDQDSSSAKVPVDPQDPWGPEYDDELLSSAGLRTITEKELEPVIF